MKRILFAILIIISLTGDSYSQRIPFAFWNHISPDTIELETPILIAPADDTTGVVQEPLLDWDGVIYATNYIVQMDNDTNFSPPTWADTTVNSKSTVELGLAQGTTWYWRVLAYNMFDTSEWSVTYSFTVTTGPALTTPVLIFPADDTTNISQLPILDWDTVINVRHYVVQLSDNTTFTTIHWSDSLTRSTATVDTTLDYSTTWYWRVIAYNNFDTSNWSDTNSFTVRDPNLSAPTLITPANGDTGQVQSPTLVWSGVDDAEFYNVQLTQYSDFSSVLWNTSSFDTLKLVSSSLLNGTKWYWRVRSINATDTSSWSSSFAFIVTEGSSAPRAYYIDGTDGKDEYNGRSSTTPWQTLTQFNSRTFIPGDTVKFKGDINYSGTLTVDDSGSATAPIIITSYNGARANIVSSSNSNGIYCLNKGNIKIISLNVKSDYDSYGQDTATHNAIAGIKFLNTGSGKKANILIDSCYISGFNTSGIYFSSYNADSTIMGGYRNIDITNTVIDSIGHIGIFISYSPAYGYMGSYGFGNFPNQDVTIINTKIYYVPGITTRGNYTGVGMEIGNTDTGRVSNCIVHDCGLKANGAGGGPDAIEIYGVNSFIVEYNETYNQKNNGADGSGIHFDNGVTNSIVQYNYSHNNQGAGISLYCNNSQYYRDTDSNIVIRYNILENNMRDTLDGGNISMLAGVGTTMHLIKIYNNTVYSSNYSSSKINSCFAAAGTIDKLYIWNNALLTDANISQFINMSITPSNTLIQGNLYWNSLGAFKITDGVSTYTSFNYWQAAKSRELLSGINVGKVLNPQFIRPGLQGTLGNTLYLDTMTAYLTTGASGTKEYGINIDSLYSENIGTEDFFGNTLRQNYRFDIGAYENPDSYIWQDTTKLFIGKSLSAPLVARQYLYDSLYLLLQRDTLLRNTRALNIFATSDTNLALRNLKIDSTIANTSGGITFITDGGYKNSGTTGIIKTNINPRTSTNGVFTINNMGTGVYILDNVSEPKTDIGAYNGTYIFLRTRNDVAGSLYLNTNTPKTFTTSNSKGLTLITRPTSDSEKVFINGELITNGAVAVNSDSIPSSSIVIGGIYYGNTLSEVATKNYSAWWLGSNLSAARQLKLCEVIDWWMRRQNISVIPPLPVTLSSPALGEDSVSINPTFDWDSVASADSYHIQMSFQPSFTSLVGEITGLTNSRYIVNGTNPGATGGITVDSNENIYWRVRGVNENGNGNWSSTYNFLTISNYSPEAISLFSRFENGVGSTTRKDIIDSLITKLKADTIWSKLDVFYVFAAEDTSQANQNWISSSYRIVRKGTTMPTLAIDSGYSGNGSTGYLTTQWSPATNGVNYTLNDGSYGVYSRSNVDNTKAPLGVYDAGFTKASMVILRNSNAATPYVNDVSGGGIVVTNSTGFFTFNRISSGTKKVYRNGVQLGSDLANTSTALATNKIYICANDANGTANNFDTRQISVVYFGSSFSAYKQARFNDNIEWYLNRIRCVVTVPSQPTLTVPVNAVDSTSITPDFDWTDVGANYYQIEIDDDIAFGIPFYSANIPGSEETGENIGGLNNNTVYYWRVRGVNSIGTGAWSSTYSFTTTP